MIKPYYQDDHATIYCGDCREILPKLPPADLLLTDPPYEQSKSGGGMIADRPTYQEIAKTISSFTPMEYWDLLRDSTKTQNGYIFTSRLCLSQFIDLVEYDSLNWDLLIYAKDNPPPLKNYRYLSSFEFILFHRGKGSFWNNDAPFHHYSKIKKVRCKPREYGHPTEKYPSILAQLIGVSSKPGQMVIDPFMGSGSTLVAAKLNIRNSIGIEIEEKYCEIAAKRLSQGVLPLGE